MCRAIVKKLTHSKNSGIYMPIVTKLKAIKETVQGLINEGAKDDARQLIDRNKSTLGKYPILLNDLESSLLFLSNNFNDLIKQASSIPDTYEKELTVGMFLTQTKQPSEGLTHLATALEIRKDDPVACYYAGRACSQKGLFKEAAQLYQSPKDQMLPETWIELGRVKNSLGEISAALSCFEKSFELFQDDESFLTLLVFIRDQLRIAQNIDWGLLQRIRQLLEFGKENFPEFRVELTGIKGDVASISGKFKDAEKLYREVVKADPKNLSARNNLACTLFTQGKFKEGYKFNANRNVQDGKILDIYDGVSSVPLWEGQPLSGKSLIIFDEQGLGDKILHYRYLIELTSTYQLSDVVMVVQERLRTLLGRSGFNGVRFISTDAKKLELNGFDYRCHLCDLPRFLGPDNVKQVKPIGKYLSADPLLVARYRERYADLFPNKLKVGINWKSDSLIAGKRKNLPINEMSMFLKLKNVQWVCLQYGDIDEDISELQRQTGSDIFVDKTVDHVNDLESSVAQISALDLVISISNATAHLAGALGIETIVMTPKAPLWHWLTEGDSSCWYSSVSLIRQTEFNTWDHEFLKLSEVLISKGATEPKGNVTIGELKTLLSKGKLEEIAKVYELADINTLTLNHKKLIAEALVILKLYGEANKLISPHASESMDDPELLLLFAKIGRGKKQYDNSLTILSQIKEPKFEVAIQLEVINCLLGKKEASDSLFPRWEHILKISKSSYEIDLITKFFMDQRDYLQRYQHVDLNRLDFVERALDLYDDAFGNRNPVVGLVLRADMESLKGSYLGSVNYLKKAVKVRPELADSLNLSMAYSLLAIGEFRTGFKNLTKRLEIDKRLTNVSAVHYPEIPVLQEKNLKASKGKTLMINAEQGIGDQVLNFHFLNKFLKKYAFKIVLRSNRKLVQLAKRALEDNLLYIDADSKEVPREVLNKVDYQMNIADIPQYILEAFDNYQPEEKVLIPDASKVESFTSKYRELFGNKKLIGISWRSASSTWGGGKDLSLENLLPILKNPEYQCISIQYADVAEEIEKCNREHGTNLYLDRSFDATEDVDTVFAQIAALDHVVTVSNVNAHFSGTLHVPCEVILRKLSLWHWHYDTDKSLWYPTVSLHREQEFNDWQPIIERIDKKLLNK